MVSIAYVGYKYRPELASDEWFEAAAAYPGKVWQAITEVNKTQHEVLFGP
jgi:hypothetical protein